MTLANDVFVLGVGMCRFGGPKTPLDRRVIEASLEAIEDSDLSFTDMETLYHGTCNAPLTFGTGVVKNLGLTGLPMVRVENASATGGAAFHEAVQAVSCGRVDVAMALAYDDTLAANTDSSARRIATPYFAPGILPMAFFSLWAVRRMEEYGTTIETLAQIAAKNWNNARLNPKAERQSDHEVTVDEVLRSRMLAHPHTARMAAPQGAGAAAAIVGSAAALRRIGRRADVRVLAAQAHSERYVDGHLFAGAIVGPPEMVQRGAFAAYEESGIGPEDLRVIQLHDAYAIEELLYYEEIGLCGPGEGDRLVHDGETTLGGRWPTSTDGGFIGRGHPAGPSGLAQIWELTNQLRGRAGPRQIDRPTNGLAHIIGAGSVCYTHILQAA